MTEKSSANLELAIVLPLGVVANQLMRIEAELRLLNMKALVIAKENESAHLSGLLGSQLENINESLESIRRLLSDFEADIGSRTGRTLSDDTPSPSRNSHPPRDD
jgi:hypothetical protein